jgi:hypothetical protein
VHDLLPICKQFLRSPRAFLAKAREASERLELEQQVAAGVAPLQPVYDDLPNVGLRTITVDDRPRALDVLIPGLKQHLAAGPNTALDLTYRPEAADVPVRNVSTGLPHDEPGTLAGRHQFREHARPECAHPCRPRPRVTLTTSVDARHDSGLCLSTS